MGSIQVTIRLSDEAWARYSAQAETRGVALSTYLRQRLERQDEFLDSELALRARPAAPDPSPPPGPSGETVEMLLLLRVIAGPQNSRMIHAEVERQGFMVWSGDFSPRR